MKKLICLIGLLFSISQLSVPLEAAQISAQDFLWVQAVSESGAKEIQICGSSKIVPSKASIKRHFFTGATARGYFVTGLPSIERYFQILADNNLEAAKVEITKLFSNAELWTLDKENSLPASLGKPSSVDLPFTATVKDCVEGAKTTLGNDCSKNSGASLLGCCREKFLGPIVNWGTKLDHKLYFSPDPSVSLKVPGERTHRYCNVAEPMRIKEKLTL
ncbi:MAG: hypothetical protein J0L82_10470 [Deltaproteobacteria bacterium]|jgi:hypothetical protein|nr:hypothetical protein [Deltaproteobacteria bacterium]